MRIPRNCRALVAVAVAALATLTASLVGCAPAAGPAPGPTGSGAATPPPSTAAATTSAPSASSPSAATSAIRAAGLSARIRFLSDDLLEGRFTGSRGHAIAERYVASELAALGAEPAGDKGTFLQTVPMRGATKDAASQSFVVKSPGKPDLALKLEDDFILSSDMRVASVDTDAPLVFAGYGVTAPEYAYDDFAGIDVKGKIVVVFARGPGGDSADWFPPMAHAIYGDRDLKAKRLAARGAVGFLTVYRPEDEASFPWVRAAKQSRIEQMTWTKKGEPGSAPAGVPVRGSMTWRAFDTILARAGSKETTATLLEAAKGRRLKGFALGASARVKLKATFRDIDAHNVVGVLRGSDPKLASEYVVYSAHLDHVGVGAPFDGDTIYNGALDNASGTAAMLEIARAFAALPKRPARSILFLSCTGEERGLLGSEYFAQNPTVPAGSIVADLNSDMILALGPSLRDVVVLGGDHSTLGPIADSSAKSLGLVTSPDPEPKQVHFVRSDQYSFVAVGIPSLDVEAGLKDENGHTEPAAARRQAWVASKYHGPKDEWDPGYDYEGMAQVARLDFLVGLDVANASTRPQWNKDDLLVKLVETTTR